jgi:pimeloyl-ACP methyl ester carboxylesterase
MVLSSQTGLVLFFAYPTPPINRWTIFGRPSRDLCANAPDPRVRRASGGRLQILELPPQDYHVAVASRVETNRAGKTMLTLSVVTNNAVNFGPRSTPATLFLLHGYRLSKESMITWALHLAQTGYRVVLVDLRGHGQFTVGRKTLRFDSVYS